MNWSKIIDIFIVLYVLGISIYFSIYLRNHYVDMTEEYCEDNCTAINAELYKSYEEAYNNYLAFMSFVDKHYIFIVVVIYSFIILLLLVIISIYGLNSLHVILAILFIITDTITFIFTKNLIFVGVIVLALFMIIMDGVIVR